MDTFSATASKPNFAMKLWRGERMCLVAFDVAAPEADLVGFAIECKPPGAKRFSPLLNRLAFSYDEPIGTAVTGDRLYSSKKAPFQKFRWVHFPFEPKQGLYTYRGIKMHERVAAKPKLAFKMENVGRNTGTLVFQSRHCVLV